MATDEVDNEVTAESEILQPDSETVFYGLVAEYDSPGALIQAAEQVRDAGYEKWDSPHARIPLHGIDPAMGIRSTILPVLVFVGGMTGTALAILMQWWMNAKTWQWVVSGKPYFSLAQQIPIAFELTVLLAGFTTFFGMWALNKLPQVWHPLFKKDRFLKATTNGFFISRREPGPALRSRRDREAPARGGRHGDRGGALRHQPEAARGAAPDPGLHPAHLGAGAGAVRVHRQVAHAAQRQAALPHRAGHGLPAGPRRRRPSRTCSPTIARRASR